MSTAIPKDKGDVDLSLFNTFFVYVSYTILLFFGHLRDFLDYLRGRKTYETPAVRRKIQIGDFATHLHTYMDSDRPFDQSLLLICPIGICALNE